MRILDLALKDLSQILRDRRALLFLVAMPIGFTLFMGFAYRGGGAAPADPRQPLGWVNHAPDSALAQALRQQLDRSAAVRVVELAPAAAAEALRRGEVAGLLIIPAGFEAGAANGIPALTLVTEPAALAGQTLYQPLRDGVTRLFSAVEIGRLSAETAGRPGDEAEAAAAFTAAAAAWDSVDSAQWITVEQAAAPVAEPAWYGDNPYNQASPGILVQFAIFSLVTSGQILVQERQSRTLQRMLTTSFPPAAIIAGHALAMFALVLLQELLLVAFGQWVLGVNYARAPLGVLLVAAALAAWVAALGLLIGVVARDDSQVILFSLLAMFLFSALGGTWFPLEAAAGPFAAVGQAMPSAWAMTGFQNILLRGLGSGSAWLPAGVLALYALGFFGLAVWRFGRLER